WKAQGAPVYDPNILKPRAEDGEMPEDDQGPDELYDQAIAAVSDMRFISISLLQRKLRVGYNRAARMIERMERDGIVGPADGAKPREVLIRPLGELPGAGAWKPPAPRVRELAPAYQMFTCPATRAPVSVANLPAV